MKRTLRTAGAIPAIAALLLAASPAAGAPSPAVLALQYLGRNQKADGSMDGATANGPGETEDLIFAAAANGYDPNTLRATSCKSVYDYLASVASAGTQLNDSKGKVVPAKVAKLVMAVAAGAGNPRAFGVPNPRDLLATLQATYQASNGSYGTAAYAFDESLVMLALRAAGDPSYPVMAASVTYLENAQDADGGWGYGGSSDTNSTALSLMALAALNDSTGRAKALSYLHSEQTKVGNGGFAFSSAYGTTPDPDSDAVVIQALVAAGEDPTGSAWTVAGKTPMADLLSFQDGVQADPGYGGFTAALPLSSNPPDAFTTGQLPAGLARVAFPIPRSYSKGALVPGAACPSGMVSAAATASPTTNPTASPSPSPSPTATPAATPSPSPGAGTAAALLAQTGGGPGAVARPLAGLPLPLLILALLASVAVAWRWRRLPR